LTNRYWNEDEGVKGETLYETRQGSFTMKYQKVNEMKLSRSLIHSSKTCGFTIASNKKRMNVDEMDDGWIIGVGNFILFWSSLQKLLKSYPPLSNYL
jgi:hypothetical protein